MLSGKNVEKEKDDSLARALLPAIQSLFETEEGQREFEEWKAERQNRQLNTKLNKEKSC